MAYNRPDIFFERVTSQEKPIKNVGTSLTGFVGIVPRGKIRESLECSSWSEFVDKVAYGLSSPFLATSYLAYAVYGFFANGGNKCVIQRAAHTVAASSEEIATKATCKCPATTGITITALDEGTWANGWYVKITANAANSSNFDVAVYDGDPATTGKLKEVIENVSNTSTSSRYYGIVVNGVSSFIVIASGATLVAATSSAFAGGLDGVSTITDTDYTNAISAMQGSGINILAVPGQVSKTIRDAVNSYCTGNYCFGILDIASSKTPAQAVTDKNTNATASDYTALYYPWVYVNDPITNASKKIPPSGHVAGVYARTDATRGVHKAPAGIEATINGVINLEYKVGNSDLETLTPAQINSIIPKSGYGIVVWGARTMSSGERMYISDTRFDINIEQSCSLGTAWVIFEPNDELLWQRFSRSLEAFLYSKWKDDKALRGEKKEDAYYIKCDSEINTEATINQGIVIAEIGYSRKKPAEFVVIRIVQKA